MNAENIINQISKEKESFLDQFNEKKRFDKETRDYFDFLSSDDGAAAFVLCFMSSMVISAISGITLAHLFPAIKDILDGFFIFPLSICFGVLIVFTVNKSISRLIFNRLYNNRDKNNIISKLFKSYFYKANISDEIHNMLKVYLSDDDYVHLVKKGITYKNAYSILNEIVENEKIIANKREVFLTPEEIKKYQYSNNKDS